MRAAVLRAFQVYGPGDHPTRLVPVVLDAARTGAAVPLPVRLSRRDWVWVGDVVDACVRAADDASLPPGIVLNIGTGVQTSTEELVATAEAGHRPADRHRARRPPRPLLGHRGLGQRSAGRRPAAGLDADRRPRRGARPHLGGGVTRVAVVVPVYGNAPTLRPLAARLAAALDGRDWRLRLVVDASPDDSAAVARALAEEDPRIAVTALTVNVGQHRALARGLADEPDADVLGVPGRRPAGPAGGRAPAARPAGRGATSARCSPDGGAATSRRPRRLTGSLHRRLAARLTGLPPDAGAFLAMGPGVRRAVLAAVEGGAPSVVLAVARAGEPVTSLPVARDVRPEGRSAWTGRARLPQSVRSLAWAVRRR